jgi:hypothetical protein
MVGYARLGVRGLGEFAATIRALDASEFPPAAALQREILAAAEASGGEARDFGEASAVP